MRSVTIRPARPGDVAALHALAALTFPLACPMTTTEEAKRAFIAEHLSESAFAAAISDPLRALVVAEEAGSPDLDNGIPGASSRLAAYSLLVAGEPSDVDAARAVRTRPTLELSKLYAHPDAHGTGVAAALVDSCLDIARAAHAASVWLGVNVHNVRANRFYEKHGFAIVGEKRFALGEVREEDWVRERMLG